MPEDVIGGARTADFKIIGETVLTNLNQDQHQGRGVAAPPAAILFCHATKEYAEKGTHALGPLRHNGNGRSTSANIDNAALMRYLEKVIFFRGVKMRGTSHR